MYHFKYALVRRPCRAMVNGITSANLGIPDWRQAVEQHDAYIAALEESGLKVHILAADEHYADSVFVEDTAVMLPGLAIIARPGAMSRRGETEGIREIFTDLFSEIHDIKAPGTLDGGDVLFTNRHLYVGISQRTNEDGARQLLEIAHTRGIPGEKIRVHKELHLKSAVAALNDNTLIVSGECSGHPVFRDYSQISVERGEEYAANCLNINNTILLPAGFTKTLHTLQDEGFSVKEVPASEFRKLDGGLSCLSLRF